VLHNKPRRRDFGTGRADDLSVPAKADATNRKLVNAAPGTVAKANPHTCCRVSFPLTSVDRDRLSGHARAARNATSQVASMQPGEERDE